MVLMEVICQLILRESNAGSQLLTGYVVVAKHLLLRPALGDEAEDELD
jgi:hypothetical protein